MRLNREKYHSLEQIFRFDLLLNDITPSDQHVAFALDLESNTLELLPRLEAVIERRKGAILNCSFLRVG